METLVETLDITRLARSQALLMAKELDEQVDAEFRAQELYFQFSGGWQIPLSRMKRRSVARSGGRTPGCVNLIWPRVDGLIWPHLVLGRG